MRARARVCVCACVRATVLACVCLVSPLTVGVTSRGSLRYVATCLGVVPVDGTGRRVLLSVTSSSLALQLVAVTEVPA